MIQDIDKHIQIINDSIQWAKDFHKESFNFKGVKEYRRQLKKIRNALSVNCSAAAYGESQVGKSYLMSSLLSSANHPFVIKNGDKEYSFIDQLNPSGGKNTKIESTGVVTRFTIKHDDTIENGNRIKIKILSVVDLVLMLTDSYYNDIKINPDTILTQENIDEELSQYSELWKSKESKQEIITEDDINDIQEYVDKVIGGKANPKRFSKFWEIVSQNIQYVSYDKWVNIFSLLWNKNTELNRLFTTLISSYKKLKFQEIVYVPFQAVLYEKGTLLKIEWLDTVCGVQIDTGNDEIYTDVYDVKGIKLASEFGKGELSALIAELTFELPESLAEDRKFLRKMDLLDFPGARSREIYKEQDIETVLPKILRRGKVAYLFNKYSISFQISSVLFCHHNDQKSEPTIGETINSWIETNIGANIDERSRMLNNTQGIAPLFFVATKFNFDLKIAKTDTPQKEELLDQHWSRFDKVFPEIVKPNEWLDKFTTAGGSVIPFQNIYLLRDFYWSEQHGLFDGYQDGTRGEKKSEEIRVHEQSGFPNYLDCLKQSFLRNSFVRTHFKDPGATWNSVATLNNDGSKAIISALDTISGVLDNARKKRYLEKLCKLKKELNDILQPYAEPKDATEKNQKVRMIAGDIRRALVDTIVKDPIIFGRIIDQFMVGPEELRSIAYDIIVRHIDTPKDFGEINFYRASAGIDINDTRAQNIQRLMDFCFLDSESELQEYFLSKGIDLEDIISGESETLSTLGGVITKHIVERWIEDLNKAALGLSETLPHAIDVVDMLIKLFDKLKLRRQISEKIGEYLNIFSENEQPNVIGDYASLILNKFVSSVGRSYMSDDAITMIEAKAADCRIPVDTSPMSWERTRKSQSLIETLQVLDESADIINKGRIDMTVLRKLPFWNNYKRWENLVLIGLIYSSDISHCDPKCNEKVESLITQIVPLYTDLH
jgi:hypothetical protein